MAAKPSVTYHEAYQAVKLRRRSEVGALQKTATDNHPISSFMLGGFFLLFGILMSMLFPPIGAVIGLVGLIGFGRGIKLMGVRRDITRTLEDEHVRWAMVDSAMERLTPPKFETLASAVEGQGSYESVTGWMMRNGLDEQECNALILAAAVAAEERGELIRARSDPAFKARHRRAVAEGHEPLLSPVGDDDPIDHGAEDPRTASAEGLHAQLLAEEDEIARKVREARAARRHPGARG